MKEAYSNLTLDEEIGFFGDDDNRFMKYILFLVLKHFTHLKDQIPDALDEQLAFMDEVISIGLFERAFNEILPPDQVQKVLDKVTSFAELALRVQELEDQMKETVKESVQHPVMKKRVGSDA